MFFYVCVTMIETKQNIAYMLLGATFVSVQNRFNYFKMAAIKKYLMTHMAFF